MSQFDPHGQHPGAYADPYAAQAEPPRTSGLAIGSLVLSLIAIIPCLGLLTGPIGALLGIIAVVTIKAPYQKGKGLAAAGIVLGIVFAGAQIYLIKMAVDTFVPLMESIQKGPDAALTEGFAGNLGSFKGDFEGRGATLSDEAILGFVSELRDRYGEFEGMRFDEMGGQTVQPPLGQQQFVMPYLIDFENATVSADVEIIMIEAPGKWPPMEVKFGFILVKDPDLGDLRYPPADDEASTPAASDADADADADAADAGGGV